MDKAEVINTVYPVTGVRKIKGGVLVLKRTPIAKLKNQHICGKRERITKMTSKSISNLVGVIQTTEVSFKSMITLTYGSPWPKDGQIVKEDVHVYTQWLRKRYKSHYLWFLEFQKRGAPHLHVLLEQGELTPKMRVDAGIKWVERSAGASWFIDAYGDGGYAQYNKALVDMLKVATHYKTWERLKHKEGAKRYVTKYASKQYQKEVPEGYRNVGRFWGCSDAVSEAFRSSGIELDVTDEEVRRYLAENEHKAADWEVLPQVIFGLPF